MRTIFKLILIFLLLATISSAQGLESIQKSFKQYNDNVLQEKIYAHTDKNFYLTGEILWFKLYNVDAGLNTPVNISKIAYVDVLDETNNPVLQAKVSLTEGVGSGSFYIPITLKNGNYKLRAYTNWMKNFDPQSYFEKTLTIINPLAETTSVTANTTTKNNDINFFAEGGNLVGGVTSTVGFKATGPDGKGMEMSGVVVNQHNDTVLRFRSLKFGMGSFTFTPQVGGAYKAIIRLGRDNALIRDLPVVNNSGYVVHLTETPQPELKISARGNGSNPIYLVVHNGHQVTYAQTVVPDANGDATISLSKEKLGKGINHFTLFNSQRQPVAERLYFNRPALLNVLADGQLQYKTRSAVAININAKDNTGKPQAANMSVAVFRLDSLNNTDEADIAAYLWLGSEIKGDIESPSFYFTAVTAETEKAVDNLLLTQGWSRFKWADVLSPSQKFTYLPESHGHLVTGQVNNAAGTAATNVLAYMGVIGKQQFYGSRSDSTGHIAFETKDFYGPGEIVLQTGERDTMFRISLATPFSEKFSANKLPLFRLSGQMQDALENSAINMQVQNIYNGAKLKQYLKPTIDTNAFFNGHGKVYMLDAYTRFNTMEEDLREYVAEVTIAKRQKRFHINVLNQEGFLPDVEPMVLLDGVPILNIDKVFTIDPLKIKKLEMVNHEYYWGPTYENGILNFSSYKGDMGGYELDPHAIVLDYEGMQLQREFYSPVYDTQQQQKSRLPDFRNVLYWAPDVDTDTNGNAKISFYTSDKTGKYVAVMQGLTTNGLAGSYYLKFDVNK